MSFKEFDQSTDIKNQLSAVNEVIPLTGTFFSGTAYTKYYVNITSGSAVSGGFWETVYDGAPTSVSSSALCDVTYGHSSASFNAGRSETFLNTEKQRMYEQMASYLLGNKNNIFIFNSVSYYDLFFLSFKRRIMKDEVKKGNTTIAVQLSGADGAGELSLADTGAATSYTVGVAGDEAPLYSGSTEVGRVYYNAGIVAIVTGAFYPVGAAQGVAWSGSAELAAATVTGTLDNIIDGFSNRVQNIQFLNQTNLHSTIYFCRALNNEFNYSTNPTFVDSDYRIVPTSGSDNQTRTYITSVGLYSINNELLAAAKVSEPIKKSPENEMTLRVRLNY